MRRLLIFLSVFSITVFSDECQYNICLNGGQCVVNTSDRSYKCVCEVGYSGSLCQEECAKKCANGVCIKGEQGREECKCNDGWSGDTCDSNGVTVEGCVTDENCPDGQKCTENAHHLRVCAGNPCDSTPCENNGTCHEANGDYKCECSQGFTGPRCESDVNECALTPCRNGGTCINLSGTFECICNVRYKGPLCADVNSSCVPNPCQNSASCVEVQGDDYHCLCGREYTGKNCSEKVISSQCAKNPCLHGGKCVPQGSTYECLCPPNYEGTNCEDESICSVQGQQCKNGGSCVQALTQSYCRCPPDYGGILCETLEIASTPDPCEDKPCQNGGTCSIFNGSSVCSCPSGFHGPSCGSPNAPEFDACRPNPCANGGKCMAVGGFQRSASDPAESGFECYCLDGFNGLMCEDRDLTVAPVRITTATQNVPTKVHGTSTVTLPQKTTHEGYHSMKTTSTTTRRPITITNKGVATCDSCIHADKCVETLEGALCVCNAGYSGATCAKQENICSTSVCASPMVCRPLISTLDTVLSCSCPRGTSGPQCDKKTTVTFGPQSLFIYQSPSVMIGSASGPLPYSLSLSFRTTLPRVHLASAENIFGQRLFSALLVDGYLSLNVSGSINSKLLSLPMNDGEWYKLGLKKTEKDLLVTVVTESGYLVTSRSLPRVASFDVFSTRIGKISEKTHFVGCISDVEIDGNMLDIAESSRAIGIQKGCNRVPQCTGNQCQNGGQCLDLWTEYACECKAPFLPPFCLHSLPPTTFGHKNLSSFAEISIPIEISSQLTASNNIQLIIRTNKPDASILYLGEASTEDVTTFTAVQIHNGSISVRSRAGGKLNHELLSQRRIDDNEDHLIEIVRTQRHVKLMIDSVLEAEGDLPSRFDHPIFSEKLRLGSPEDSNHDAFTERDFFKGSIQDIRVNGYSALLHDTNLDVDGLGRVEKKTNIIEGSVTDDVCAASKQCLHGSCKNTFNDFKCFCERGYFGRRCDQKDYCVTKPCPEGGVCQNIIGGFICTSEVSLVKSSHLQYELSANQSVSIDSIDLTIRTHSQVGDIISVDSPSGHFGLSLSNGQLVITTSTPFTVRKTISDGNWRRLRIEGNILRIDNSSYGLPTSFSMSSSPASGESTVRIGSSADTVSFEGCLKDIHIGSELPPLSFYSKQYLNIPDGLPNWKLGERKKISTSCLSTPQCGVFSPCLNGQCRDQWNKYSCDCHPGFTGQQCEINIDECKQADCGHGYCIDGVNDYRCVCDAGFTGVSCDAVKDLCSEVPCKNGGLCESGNGSYTCECKAGYLGRHCEVQGPPSCNNNPCLNGGICSDDTHTHGQTGTPTCTCPAGFIGSFCEEKVDFCQRHPCKNGVCENTQEGFKCICQPGFTGPTCSEFEDLCTPKTCSKNGECSSVWNGTVCNCDEFHRGLTCSEDVNECSQIPCENDGKCVNRLNGYECKCMQYYMGGRCELLGSCLQNPCDHGECIQMKQNEHFCSCHKGYEGEKCDKRINYCKSDPCRNGGTCESLLENHKCSCIPGFIGLNCEVDRNECDYGFCSNGASCRDRINDYECLCEGTGFSGKNCTTDIDECRDVDACVNGRCTNTNGGYKCDCEQGFIGSRCSMRNPCIADDLNRTLHSCVHGKCINPTVKIEHGHEISLHECSCIRGYTGPQCSLKMEEKRIVFLSYILGPAAAVLFVLCLLGCCLFIFVWRGKRALHGHYSPSHQEVSGARMQMNQMIKLPPEERLI